MDDFNPSSALDDVLSVGDTKMNSPTPPPPPPMVHSDFQASPKLEDSPNSILLHSSEDNSSGAEDEPNVRDRGSFANRNRFDIIRDLPDDGQDTRQPLVTRNYGDRGDRRLGTGMYEQTVSGQGPHEKNLQDRADRPSSPNTTHEMGPPAPVQMKVRKKPGPPKTHQAPIKKDDMDAKKGLVQEIERHWGQGFIKKFIPKIHRPLIKRKKGQGRSMRRPQDDPTKWMPSILKAILEVAKKCDDVKRLKILMGDVVRYRNAHTGNKKPQLVTTDFDMIEDILDRGWDVPQAFAIRYKHLINNRLEITVGNPEEEYAHLFLPDSGENTDEDHVVSDSEDDLLDDNLNDQELTNDFQLESGYTNPPPVVKTFTTSARGFINNQNKPSRTQQNMPKNAAPKQEQGIRQQRQDGYNPAVKTRIPDSSLDNSFEPSPMRGQQTPGYGQYPGRNQAMNEYNQYGYPGMRGAAMTGYGYGPPPMYGQQASYGFGYPFPHEQFARPGAQIHGYSGPHGMPATPGIPDQGYHPRQSMGSDPRRDPRNDPRSDPRNIARTPNLDPYGRSDNKRRRASPSTSPDTPLSQIRPRSEAPAMYPPQNQTRDSKAATQEPFRSVSHGSTAGLGRPFEVPHSRVPSMGSIDAKSVPGNAGHAGNMRGPSRMADLSGEDDQVEDMDEGELQAQLDLIELQEKQARVRLQLAARKRQRTHEA